MRFYVIFFQIYRKTPPFVPIQATVLLLHNYGAVVAHRVGAVVAQWV
jgi:hypothetical protein